MNRLQFADSMILDMAYNDVAKKLDRRQLWAAADKHFPYILVQLCKAAGGDYILNNFNVTKICPTGFDSGMGSYYVNIDNLKPMNLEGFAGIRQIGDTQSTSNDYVPVQRGWGTIISYLEVNGLAGRNGFFLQGNRPYLYNPPVQVPPKLRVIYVPTFLGLSDTDEITCPAETVSLLADKLSQVLSIQRQLPQNEINDIKDNQ